MRNNWFRTTIIALALGAITFWIGLQTGSSGNQAAYNSGIAADLSDARTFTGVQLGDCDFTLEFDIFGRVQNVGAQCKQGDSLAIQAVATAGDPVEATQYTIGRPEQDGAITFVPLTGPKHPLIGVALRVTLDRNGQIGDYFVVAQ